MKKIRVTRDGAPTQTVELRQGFSSDDIHQTIAKSVKLAPSTTFMLEYGDISVATVFAALQDNVQYTVIPFDVQAASQAGLPPAEIRTLKSPKLKPFEAGTLLEASGFKDLCLW